MKRLGLLGIAILILMMPTACNMGFPLSHNTSAPTPPPNPASVTVTISGYSYPGAVTIRPGGTVCWENPSSSFSDHVVQFDDLAGGCTVPQTITIGGSLCIPFATKGLYEYYDPNFGYCNNNCNNCQGMAGFVRVE